jgi:hypothetical protein
MSLEDALTSFNRAIERSQELVIRARGWVTTSWQKRRSPKGYSIAWRRRRIPLGIQPFEREHEEMLVELAFFKSFLYWEKFLEKSFIAYLMGDTPPKGNAPRRYFIPPNPQHAETVLGGHRGYIEWAAATNIISKAEHFFEEGGYFRKPIKGKQSKLEEIRKVRNAIAHISSFSEQSFQSVVRERLGHIPASITVGSFLLMRVPDTSPPISFLDEYLSDLRFLANEIVPS